MNEDRNEPIDQKILEPLKRRPNLEPDTQFVSSLRTRLMDEAKRSSRIPVKKPALVYLSAFVLAAALFFMLAVPYLPSFNDHASEQPAEKTEEVKSMSFEEIIAENDAYSKFYDMVGKALNGPYLIGSGPAKTTVYYFESLRIGDAETLAAYLFEGDLQTAQKLIEHYEGMDHTSIEFENMVQIENGDSYYDIFFTYLDSGETKSGSFQLKTVDGKSTYIHDLPDDEVKDYGLPEGDNVNFKLTEEESEAYERFAAGHDSEYLKGLSPISIAKLYVQAQLDSDYHTKYALYTSRKDYQLWTLEEELENAEGDMLSTGALLDSLGWVQEGEFIVDDAISGHIEFTDEYGNVRGFNMIRDEDGIWKVAFHPIQ